MIIDSFDINTKPFITPEGIYKDLKKERNDLVTIATFKQVVLDYILNKYEGKEYITFHTFNGTFTVYVITVKGKKYLTYCTPLGATFSSMIMSEVSVVTGSHKFIFFGSCGVLDENKCRGKLIVPSSTYRDEGVSYHYEAPQDYIGIRNHKVVEKVLNELNIPYVSGKTWTTDAIYMETLNKVEKRKKDDNLAVDMEVSGVEAVGKYYNIDNYHFLFSADSLDSGSDWNRYDLGGDKENSLQLNCYEIALEIASRL